MTEQQLVQINTFLLWKDNPKSYGNEEEEQIVNAVDELYDLKGVNIRQWRVFVLSKYDENLKLKKDAWIVYQVCQYEIIAYSSY